MLTCPMSACDHVEYPDPGTLAAHLSVVHLLAPSEAMRRARAIQVVQSIETLPMPGPPAPKEATPMPNETYVCGKCGGKGHNARSPECPEKGETAVVKKSCGYCKHTDHVYADCPMAQARRKGKTRKPVTRTSPKAVASVNGFGGALAALRAEHADLTAAIAALERLEARGR